MKQDRLHAPQGQMRIHPVEQLPTTRRGCRAVVPTFGRRDGSTDVIAHERIHRRPQLNCLNKQYRLATDRPASRANSYSAQRLARAPVARRSALKLIVLAARSDPAAGSALRSGRRRGRTCRRNNLGLPPLVESVVHPTDFSPASERAFAHALAIALLRQTSLALLHVDKDEHQRWNEFPHVRATLERWNLLKPGSTQEDVFAELGVRVSKHALSGRFPAARCRAISNARRPTCSSSPRKGVKASLAGCTARSPRRWRDGRRR